MKTTTLYNLINEHKEEKLTAFLNKYSEISTNGKEMYVYVLFYSTDTEQFCTWHHYIKGKETATTVGDWVAILKDLQDYYKGSWMLQVEYLDMWLEINDITVEWNWSETYEG